MTLTTAIILLFIAFLLVVAEIFLIPGTGIVGIIGIVFLLIGVWIAVSIGTSKAYLTLAFTGVLSVALIILSFRANTWKRFALKSSVEGVASTWSELQVGEKGKTISRISPMGKARFNEFLVEVSSNGDLIPEQKDIEIIQIIGKKIIVQPLNSKA